MSISLVHFQPRTLGAIEFVPGAVIEVEAHQKLASGHGNMIKLIYGNFQSTVAQER